MRLVTAKNQHQGKAKTQNLHATQLKTIIKPGTKCKYYIREMHIQYVSDTFTRATDATFSYLHHKVTVMKEECTMTSTKVTKLMDKINNKTPNLLILGLYSISDYNITFINFEFTLVAFLTPRCTQKCNIKQLINPMLHQIQSYSASKAAKPFLLSGSINWYQPLLGLKVFKTTCVIGWSGCLWPHLQPNLCNQPTVTCYQAAF